MSVGISNYHHENCVGSGYPTGIKENEIPLASQIVAVVGAYCALTEHRNYRDAFSKEQAIEIIDSEAGSKYNPEIVDIMKKIARQMK